MAVERFSRRYGFSGAGQITVRDEAPPWLREALLQIALGIAFNGTQIRTIVCQTLRKSPNPYTTYDADVLKEAEELLQSADWFRVYDFVEAVFGYAAERTYSVAEKWQQEVNQYFQEAGVGWQMVDGVLEVRGAEGFEITVRGGVDVLHESGHKTASSELHEAIRDLSRRPEPDLTGAVQHGMAALECVAREVTGDNNSTLGQIVGNLPTLIPKPLDTAVEKAWGYASERARHIREGGATDHDEAELIVGLAAALSTYLTRKAT
jgi:hypothetical protein